MNTTLDRYRGAEIPLTSGPRGARVAVSTMQALTATFSVTPRMIEVAPKVYNLVGIGISSRMMIDAPEGLVIFDTGDDLEDGERALAEFRKVSDRPIKAIIYSHNHYAHGTAPFLKDSPDAIIIGHHAVNHHLNEIATGFASGGEFPEAVPALTARYERQFALTLPPEGPDTGLAAVIPPNKSKGTVPATHLMQDGQEMMVAGLKMQFFTRYFSDSEDTLTIWVPEMRLAYNNFLWPSLFNFYTLRGDVFRDPRSWRDGLRQIRDLAPEVLVNTHALPVVGVDKVRDSLNSYMDAINYLIDQTLRGINKGMSPDQLKEYVKLPKHLAEFPNNCETYSEFFYFPLHLYHHIFGWFDGDAASIHRLSQDEEARRIVEGFGGSQAVAKLQQDAMAKGDLVWSSRLAGWLRAAEPNNQAHALAHAEVLRQIAYRSPGTIARHFCLSQALELEGAISPPASTLPPVAAILSVDPARYIDFMRVRLAAERALNTEARLAVRLRDKGQRHALVIRRGVCEFVRDSSPQMGEMTLSLDHETWARLYVGKTTLLETLSSGEAEASDRSAVQHFMELFDTPQEACAWSRPESPSQAIK